MKIQWKTLDCWSVNGPEIDSGSEALIIYMPYGLPECVLMPGDDTLIPTGLWFPGLFRDFLIIPIHHTYPNKGSDVMDVWNGDLKENPILHMSVVADKSQVFVHIINLGDKELRYKPGNRVAYFCFTPIMSITEEYDEEDEEEI